MYFINSTLSDLFSFSDYISSDFLSSIHKSISYCISNDSLIIKSWICNCINNLSRNSSDCINNLSGNISDCINNLSGSVQNINTLFVFNISRNSRQNISDFLFTSEFFLRQIRYQMITNRNESVLMNVSLNSLVVSVNIFSEHNISLVVSIHSHGSNSMCQRKHSSSCFFAEQEVVNKSADQNESVPENSHEGEESNDISQSPSYCSGNILRRVIKNQNQLEQVGQEQQSVSNDLFYLPESRNSWSQSNNKYKVQNQEEEKWNDYLSDS